MPARLRAPRARTDASAGFSLIEIMVTVALLTVIVLGLVAMFSQTQRAFKSGMTQTSVLDAGRALTDMLGRELEQARAASLPAVNFYVEIPPVAAGTQALPGPGAQPLLRSNVLEDVFFLMRENLRWTAVGYRVGTPASGIGTLYRFLYVCTNSPARELPRALGYFTNAPLDNLSRVADGIVHFRLRAYDTNGLWITRPRTNINVLQPPGYNEVDYAFWSNAVPVAVDLEVGVLEPQTAARFWSIPNAASQREYLRNQAGRVHLFRQRVDLRNADLQAYR